FGVNHARGAANTFPLLGPVARLATLHDSVESAEQAGVRALRRDRPRLVMHVAGVAVEVRTERILERADLAVAEQNLRGVDPLEPVGELLPLDGRDLVALVKRHEPPIRPVAAEVPVADH